MDLIATTKTLIIGAGPTGQAVARHLGALGRACEVWDTRTDPSIGAAFSAVCPAVPISQGPIDPRVLDGFDEVVASPGVSPQTAALQALKTPPISDIQLFRRAWPANQPLIAITGSNAKSTVTTLVSEILKQAGRHVLVGGNLGPQALDLLPERTDASIAVLELSSFQLARTEKLSAQVATCLNMSPDHLDWHGDMLAYHQAKHRVFQGAKSIVVNAEDPLSQPLIADAVPKISFAVQQPDFHRFGVLIHEDEPWIALGLEPWLPCRELPGQGRHWLQNVMAACAIAHLAGVSGPVARAAVSTFQGLPHRMVELPLARGIRFIDDSKGTNVGASMAAIESVAGSSDRMWLLAGGDSKGADLSAWAEVVRKHCQGVRVFGRDRNRLATALGDSVLVCETLEEAMRSLAQEVRAGDLVLLSPACASLDQYPNYQARGLHFQQLVETLYGN